MVILTLIKELLWTEFLTDFQNVGIKIFREASSLNKKYSKILGGGLRGPKMTKNKKNWISFFQIFLLLSFLDPLAVPLNFLYFFGIVEFIPNILVFYFWKLNKNWIFHNCFSKKNIENVFFCHTAKMAEILNRCLD